jgi:hypothetical protein
MSEVFLYQTVKKSFKEATVGGVKITKNLTQSPLTFVTKNIVSCILKISYAFAVRPKTLLGAFQV